MIEILPLTNVSVYVDTGISSWHFYQLNDYKYRFFPKDLYNDLDQFLSTTTNLKLASFHVPFPANGEWLSRFEKIYNHVSHTFIFCSELHEATVEQIISLDKPNVSFYICGRIKHQFQHARVYQWMDWFITTSYFYKNIKPDLLDQKLLKNSSKEKHFDVLLGCARTHRDFVYSSIIERQLDSKVLMSYHRWANQDLKTTSFQFETEGLEFEQSRTYQHTIDPVIYYGKGMSLSQVVPISVYNQTHYSLVAETNFSNSYNFYTEKVVKPILAGRLFVAFAGQGYLEFLRELGFRTFNNVIDESYDQEPNDITRWTMAMNQLELLCSLDSDQVLEQIKEIVDHNQRLMLTTDWYGQLASDFIKELDLLLGPAQIAAG
jgi:hypothetical protein